MKFHVFLGISFLLFLTACKSTTSTKKMASKEVTQADLILETAINAHGGKRYDNANYEFIFRKNKYTFKNSKEGYEYTVRKTKDKITAFDKLTNNDFTRIINGEKIELTEKQKSSFSGSLNSVIYFATLPYKLKDGAVNKTYKGTTIIKEKKYDVLQITFDEEGGGKDHDDVFYYWINQETKVIDYLAYSYQVNSGGVRFRSAYNTRIVDGILFQDYVNYKESVRKL